MHKHTHSPRLRWSPAWCPGLAQRLPALLWACLGAGQGVRSRMGGSCPPGPSLSAVLTHLLMQQTPSSRWVGRCGVSGGRPWVQPVCVLRERAPTYSREGRGNRGEVGSQCRLWGALKSRRWRPGLRQVPGGQGGGGLWKDAEWEWHPSAWLRGCACGTEVRVQTGKLGQSRETG